MEIDWTRVRRLILPKSGKPHIGDIDNIVDYLPDVKVHGFGKYGIFDRWYIFIESKLFPQFESDVLYTIDFNHLKSYYKKVRERPLPFHRGEPPTTEPPVRLA